MKQTDLDKEFTLLEKAAHILEVQGFSATHEYPNFVQVRMDDDHALYAFGMVNGPLGYDLCDSEDNPVKDDCSEEFNLHDGKDLDGGDYDSALLKWESPAAVANFMREVIAKRHTFVAVQVDASPSDSCFSATCDWDDKPATWWLSHLIQEKANNSEMLELIERLKTAKIGDTVTAIVRLSEKSYWTRIS